MSRVGQLATTTSWLVALLVALVALAALAAFVACSQHSETVFDGGGGGAAAVDGGGDGARRSDDDSGGPHAGHDAAAAGSCETIGRTGPTKSCLLFAYCGHNGHVQIDCQSANGRCVCSQPHFDGGANEVQYEAAFCEANINEGNATETLTAALAAATRACGWWL